MKELKDFLAAIGAVYEPEGERISLNNRRFAVAPVVAAKIHDRGEWSTRASCSGVQRGSISPGQGSYES